DLYSPVVRLDSFVPFAQVRVQVAEVAERDVRRRGDSDGLLVTRPGQVVLLPARVVIRPVVPVGRLLGRDLEQLVVVLDGRVPVAQELVRLGPAHVVGRVLRLGRDPLAVVRDRLLRGHHLGPVHPHVHPLMTYQDTPALLTHGRDLGHGQAPRGRTG